MSPPHKFPPLPDDEEVILESQPDIAAGVELPRDEPAPEPGHEMNEWERTGVRPPQAYR